MARNQTFLSHLVWWHLGGEPSDGPGAVGCRQLQVLILIKVIMLTFITPGLTIRMRGTGPGWWTRPCWAALCPPLTAPGCPSQSASCRQSVLGQKWPQTASASHPTGKWNHVFTIQNRRTLFLQQIVWRSKGGNCALLQEFESPWGWEPQVHRVDWAAYTDGRLKDNSLSSVRSSKCLKGDGR